MPRRGGVSGACASNGTVSVVRAACMCTAIAGRITARMKGMSCSAKRRSTTRGSSAASTRARSSTKSGTGMPRVLMASAKSASLDGK